MGRVGKKKARWLGTNPSAREEMGMYTIYVFPKRPRTD